MSSDTVEPAPEQLAALAALTGRRTCRDDQPAEVPSDGGRESYVRYAQEVVPHLQRVGGTVRYAGSAPAQSSATAKSLGGMRFSWWSIRRRRRSSTW